MSMKTPGGRCVQCGLEETARAWLSWEQTEGWGREKMARGQITKRVRETMMIHRPSRGLHVYCE